MGGIRRRGRSSLTALWPARYRLTFTGAWKPLDKGVEFQFLFYELLPFGDERGAEGRQRVADGFCFMHVPTGATGIVGVLGESQVFVRNVLA